MTHHGGNPVKKVFLLTVTMLAIVVSTIASPLKGNVKGEFARKFEILRQLSSLCRSSNENTSLKALNSLRDVFFRNHEDQTGIATYSISVQGLIEKMNADIDRVYTGIIHLENSLKVSDPHDSRDKYMNELLKYLVISEIGLIVGDQHFFRVRDKILEDIRQSRQFVRSALYLPGENSSGDDLNIIDKLANVIDLAGYIYNEQIQWYMNSSFALQNLDTGSFTIKGDSVFSGFAINPPPRIYIPSDNEGLLPNQQQ
jgi:hypothetical protein